MTAPASLHAHHAGALHALLSHAHGLARGCKPVMPDGLLLDAPEQGRTQLHGGEPYAFGFTLLQGSGEQASQRISQVVTGLRSLGRQATVTRAGVPRPVALGGNFRVEGVEDLVSGESWKTEIQPDPEPVPAARIENETSRLQRLGEFTLRFTSPLRAHRPGGRREQGGGYFDRRFFDPVLLVRRIQGRLLSLGLLGAALPAEPGDLDLIDNELVWLDLTYGPASDRTALGGAVGSVRVGCRRPELAELIVRGQYARTGENTRFGFGAY